MIESILMNPDKRSIFRRRQTDHHPVPQSLLGIPKLGINAHDHDTFHRACGYQTPDMLLRALTYAGMRRKGYGITVETASELLELLTPEDPRSLYKANTFKPAEPLADSQKQDYALAAMHMRRYLDMESLDITHAIARIAGLEEPHRMKELMIFFRTNNPILTMNRMVTHTKKRRTSDEQVRYTWVDPMKESIRSRIVEITTEAELERLSKDRRELMMGLLNVQHGRIDKYKRNQKPSIREYVNVLAQMGGNGGADMSTFD